MGKRGMKVRLLPKVLSWVSQLRRNQTEEWGFIGVSHTEGRGQIQSPDSHPGPSGDASWLERCLLYSPMQWELQSPSHLRLTDLHAGAGLGWESFLTSSLTVLSVATLGDCCPSSDLLGVGRWHLLPFSLNLMLGCQGPSARHSCLPEKHAHATALESYSLHEARDYLSSFQPWLNNVITKKVKKIVRCSSLLTQ